MFKKKVVYKINGKKLVCLLQDQELACLAPIAPHNKDKGYSIKMSQAVIYANKFDLTDIAPEPVGSVREGVYYPKQKG